MTTLKVDTVSGIGTEGTVFEGDINFDSPNYMTLPKGTTTQSNRGRGIIGGGSPGADNNEQIEYIDIQSQGNAVDFGELISARRGNAGCSSSTRGVFASGTATNPSPAFTNSIEYITIATTSNAKDFGDLNNAVRNFAGASSNTRGVFAGGEASPGNINVIEYITIATTGDASNFGDLQAVTKGNCGMSSPTRALFAAGWSPSVTNTIDYVTIATTGDSADFGDLTAVRAMCGAVSSTTRGVIGGGMSPSKLNTIDFVTTATLGNASDFGDLIDERNPDSSQICSHVRGLFIGGENPGPTACNIIDYITIASTGNAKDFGDVKTTTSQGGGCSDSHGGLSE